MSREIPEFLLKTWLETQEDEEIAENLGDSRWIPVSSSNLAMVAYDAERYELRIAFLDGSVYLYEGVPKEEYTGLMKADSHGEYFVDNIREVYRFERIAG